MNLKISMLNRQSQTKCILYVSIYIQLYKIKVIVTESRSAVVWDGSVGLERKLGVEKAEGSPRGLRKFMRKKEYVHYLECSDGFVILHMSKLVKFYFM